MAEIKQVMADKIASKEKSRAEYREKIKQVMAEKVKKLEQERIEKAQSD